jgi:pimeloyl-ACP methyl ester carboxylesterase
VFSRRRRLIETTLSPDGIPLSFEVRGSGEPALVFVHGWSCDRRYWDRQLSPFAERHQVVAVDLAGHGESGAGRELWTIPAFGEDVVAVVKELGLGPMVLIGHSMGGDVIVEAAVRLSSQVLGLVWVDAYRTLGGPPASRDEVENFIAPFRTDFPKATRRFVGGMFPSGSKEELAEWVVSDMAAAPPDVALSALEHAITFEPSILSSLRVIGRPVVAINPDYKPTDVEALRRYGVKTVLMSGVGHFAMMEDPETFNRILAETVDNFSTRVPS